MLVEFRRTAENEFGESVGEAPSLACNPEHVAGFFGSEQGSNQSLVILANGQRFRLLATYDEVKEKLANGARFVELRRPVTPAAPVEQDEGADWGEDDGLTNVVRHPAVPAVQESAPISFAPALVAMVLGDRTHSDRSIVKTRDGRGLIVLGTFAEVKAALDAQPN